MPIYEYKCNKCGVVEVMQRITDEPLKRCPNCRSKVEKLVSRSSFILKGSGWYATDYGRSASPPASSSEQSGSSDSASKAPETPSSSASTDSSSQSGGTTADKSATKPTS